MKNIKFVDEREMLNYVIFIASCTETTVSHLDLETASKILSVIRLKSNGFSYSEIFEEINKKNYFIIFKTKIFIADKQLFSLILLNSIRTSDELVKANEIAHEITESQITMILNVLNVEKRYSSHLLRTLNYILQRKAYISTTLCKKILFSMRKITLSPLSGFKQYAHQISKVVSHYLNYNSKQLLCNINLIPVRGIDTIDLVKLMDSEFVYTNKIIINKRVIYLFHNNVESKDGIHLYERLLEFYPFEKWKEEIWPHFLPHLQNVNESG